jgi:hypothetical protein
LNDVNLTGQIVQLDSLRAAYQRFFERSGNDLSQLTPLNWGGLELIIIETGPSRLISTFRER